MDTPGRGMEVIFSAGFLKVLAGLTIDLKTRADTLVGSVRRNGIALVKTRSTAGFKGQFEIKSHSLRLVAYWHGPAIVIVHGFKKDGRRKRQQHHLARAAREYAVFVAG